MKYLENHKGWRLLNQFKQIQFNTKKTRTVLALANYFPDDVQTFLKLSKNIIFTIIKSKIKYTSKIYLLNTKINNTNKKIFIPANT